MSNDWNDVPVTDEHARMLDEQGITPEAAARHGIYSITTMDDLPEEFDFMRSKGDRLFPLLHFRWVDPNGETLSQIKLPKDLAAELDSKYLWPKGCAAEVGVIRDVPNAQKAHRLEGTKPGVGRGSSAAPELWGYHHAVRRMGSKAGVPSPHLEVFQDKSVFVMLDADAASNLNVYDAGLALHSALSMFGATEVRFIRLPGAKTVGLDDLLGKQKPE